MANKINEKIISIPPYLSTYWARVAALHIKGGVLAITLTDGDTVHVPNLDSETIQSIFHFHALHIEKDHPASSSSQQLELSKIKGMMEEGEPSVRFAFGTSLDGLGNMMQHNPAQADAPDLPQEVLQKIGAIAKIIAPADEVIVPKAEPNCNCFHCQIARVLNPLEEAHSHVEHEVTAEELQFQQWTITQTGDKLFLVVNRLDELERYNVFLGQPIGCTCGKEGCEHILAVLKS